MKNRTRLHLEVIERLAAAARGEPVPTIDVRRSVRQQIRQIQSENEAPAFVIDWRPWLAASAAAAMIAVVVASLAASSVQSASSADQSLAGLTHVVEVSLQ